MVDESREADFESIAHHDETWAHGWITDHRAGALIRSQDWVLDRMILFESFAFGTNSIALVWNNDSVLCGTLQ